ncbi:putative nucleic acid-binding Zn-ribbon protein [Pedobacter sp. UYP24]
MKKLTILVAALILLNLSTDAQFKANPVKAKIDSANIDPSLQGQYQLILAKSKTLNGYKLINPSRLSQFFQSVKDTLRTERKGLSVAKQKIAGLEKGVSGLKSEMAGTETSLAATNAKMDEISLLGLSFSKSNYNITVWTIILILALLLAFVFFRSAKNVNEAKYRTGLYDEISQEYQAYKTKANEKEKKLARELQDERNKLEELRGNR